MLDSALGWIGQIAEWLGKWFPRWETLHPTAGAVKIVGFSLRFWKYKGTRIVTQLSGIVVWWPVFTEINQWPVARQANNLQAQAIETSDGVTFVVAGMIVYEVDNLEKLLCGVSDPDDTLRDTALAAIHDACIMHSSTSLLAAARDGTLKAEMTKEARAGMRGYGVKVIRVQLTDLTRARVLRLVNSSNTEVGK